MAKLKRNLCNVRLLLAATVVPVSILIGLSPSPASASIPSGPIYVGATDPLSGSLSSSGQVSRDGENAAVDAINASGGIAGHKVKLIGLDDKSDPATGVANARELVSDKVTAIISPSEGATNQLTVPYFMKAKMPVIEYTYDSYLTNAKKYPYLWTAAENNTQSSAAVVAYAKKHGIKSIALLSDTLPFSLEASQQIASDAKKAGMKTTSASYPSTAINVTTQVKQLQQANPGALVVTSEVGQQLVFQALNQVGWSPLVLGGETLIGTPTSDITSSKITAIGACPYFVTSASQPVTALQKSVIDPAVKLYGAGPDAPTIGEGYYDTMLVIKAAVMKAKSTNPADIAKALQNLKGIQSIQSNITYGFTPGNHVGYPNSTVRLCGLDPLGPSYLPIALSKSSL